jgi:hypothetical protein
MNTIRATYGHIARPWTHEELANRFDEARRDAEQPSPSDHDDRAQSPIAILASAVPALAALDVAIHVIHVLPDGGDQGLLDHLLLSAEKNAAAALQRTHLALELDGAAHGYTAEEWLPSVYEVADRLLESARLDREPPSLVEEANAAVRWLSQAIVDMDQDAPDATSAMVDGLGRVLALRVFAAVPRDALDELNG